MTENVLIFNSQAAGDCLLGTHTAKIYKQLNPDSSITFVTRQGLVPTTNEQEMFGSSFHELLLMQEGIDYVGELVQTENGFAVSLINNNAEQLKYDRIIEQSGWYSDLGIVKSQSAGLHKEFGNSVFENTETEFSLNKAKSLAENHIRIAIAGPLDWNRKTSNERERVFFINSLISYIKNNNINAELVFLGKDVEVGNILDSLYKLNNCNLYIGPMGFHTHAAAGLGVDTIHITSVFPNEYDSPSFYHSGWHRPIKSETHCGTYACVSEKPFSGQVSIEGPPAKFGFWPKICPFNQNNLSCIHHVKHTQLIDAVDEWFNER